MADFSPAGGAPLCCACSRGRGCGGEDAAGGRIVVLATFGIGNGGTGLSSSACACGPAAANSERDKDHAAVNEYLTRMISLVPRARRNRVNRREGRALAGGPIRGQPAQDILIRGTCGPI